MKTTTQDDVLAALRRAKNPLTAHDLAERLGASERAIRRHLAALHAAGKATRNFAYVPQTARVGRYFYRAEVA